MHAKAQMEGQKALANASCHEEQFASCQALMAPRRKFADAPTTRGGSAVGAGIGAMQSYCFT